MLVLHRVVRPLVTVLAVGVLATVAVAAVRGPDTPVSTTDPVAGTTGTAGGGPALVGTVVDAAGSPVAGAAVVPAAVGGGQPVPDLVVSSGADGRFRWALRAGRYTVTAVAGERRSQPVEVEVPDAGTAEVRLVLG